MSDIRQSPADLQSSERTENPLPPWEKELLDLFVGIFEGVGLPKSMALIYGILYCAEEPMLQEDICARLGISTGSASQGLKVLHGLGAVHRQSPLGQRQSVYVPERSVRRLVSYFVDAQLRPRVNSGRERLERIRESLPEGDELAKDRIDTLLTWQKKTGKALPLITTLLGK